MNILNLIPPYIPGAFNSGHHLPLFMTAGYLRKNTADVTVTCLDGAALTTTWRALGEVLVRQFDLVILFNDFDGIDTFERTIAYIRALSPAARILTVGRLSSRLPALFHFFDLDAIQCSGDPEAAAAAYVRFLQAGATGPRPAGVSLREADGRYSDATPGEVLDADDWVLPDVREVPHAAYDQIYTDDLHKFCGIPERAELVVPVARGCPVNCAFCDVPATQGRRDRRLSPDAVIDYIGAAFQLKPFDYVSFYAPTFTLDRRWVESLCQTMIAAGSPWCWKCVTTQRHLDAPLIRLMRQAGCVRISIGLETLDPDASHSLPAIKRSSSENFEMLARWCREAGVELNCFVILGLPGDNPQTAHRTMDAVRAAGARVRPSIYTPYDELHSGMDPRTISSFNRQLFVADHPAAADQRLAYYRLFFGRDDQPTQVMRNIPRPRGVANG
jgi:hypothetical protein